MKVPATVKLVQEALNDGKCVVIGLQTTGESSLDKDINSTSIVDKCLPNLISLAQEIAAQFVESHFPSETDLYERDIKIDEFVGIQQQSHTTLHCNQIKHELLERIRNLKLPPGALDELIDKLGGPSQVAEMTGRRNRLVRNNKVSFRLEPRGKSTDDLEDVNVKEKELFMNGKKFVAIISDAASTGISLHSDRAVVNQKQRVHITLELPWSADKALQQLGRSHRSNQSISPNYKLMATSVGGEQRFVAALSKRLESLGALRGDRRAVLGDMASTNLDSKYGKDALQLLQNAAISGRPPRGISSESIIRIDPSNDLPVDEHIQNFHNQLYSTIQQMGLDEDVQNDVKRFLNRLLGLPIQRQWTVFSYYMEILTMVVNAAKQSGRYDDGVVDIHGESIKVVGDPMTIYKDNVSGAITANITLNIDRGIKWTRALEKFRTPATTSTLNGFYRSKKAIYGRHMYVLALQSANGKDVIVYRPNTGVSQLHESVSDFLLKYANIQEDEAYDGWQSQYDESLTTCLHGKQCQSKDTCMIGLRTTRVDILCGSVCPLWGTLQQIIDRRIGQLSRVDKTLRVVRVRLDNGTTVVGVRYPFALIPELLSSLESNSCKSPYSISKDDITPINARALSKALQHSRTMMDFFAPKSKPSTNLNRPSTSTTSPPPTTSGSDIKQVDDSPRTSAIDDKLIQKKPKGLKRALDTGIGSQESNKRGNSAPVCPICGVTMSHSTTNWELNRHIDQCISK
eukprot:NODE_320_length_2964_cov_43.202746_g276_i0.p1 GENE.NODE_320_length_2964_cov_43.202746_g276_i0~~NODE_320_length_2964_cov_43.202746_g276_i0.p1  ORF type:complete len:742 (-),score=180.79 NODE_320_length_2964_cov_43.202746_g276_i0:62-2287(-)